METMRKLLAASALLAPLALTGAAIPTPAVAETLTVISHAVHQKALTDGPGGNVVAEWEKATGNKVEWVTFGVPEVHERLFREAALGRTEVDVAYLLNRFVDADIIQLFEPLNDFIAKDPIEAFDGISPSLVGGLTFGGKMYGVPIRHATHGLIYNEVLLKEQGFDRPPQTFEELLAYAKKLTFTRPDGSQVHGLIFGGVGSANIIDVVRVYGGDFVTQSLEVRADSPETIQGVQLLVDLYKEGVLPKSIVSFATEDAATFMQQGRAAMILEPMDRVRTFADPKNSKYPNAFKAVAVPPLAANAAKPVAVKTEFWSLTIPKNVTDKKLAWSFIKYVSTLDAMKRQALNGNGATRAAVFEDAQVKAMLPWADALAKAVAVARVPMPGFKGSAQADDVVKEEIQAAMAGSKTAQKAMADAASRIKAILAR